MPTTERAAVLSQVKGWSLSEATGYADGEACRRDGRPPSAYGNIGMDAYGYGFRAGYYARPAIERNKALEASHVPLQQRMALESVAPRNRPAIIGTLDFPTLTRT